MKIKYIILIVIISISIICSPAYAANKTESKNTKASSSDKNDSAGKQNLTKEKTTTAAKSQLLSTTSLIEPPPIVFEGGVGKGALLSPLLSESFQTDLATGSATVSIPIVTPPGRKNMQPTLTLSYSSNSSDSICGVGWGLSTSAIQRSTKKGTPKYDSTDTFALASGGSAGDLVLIDAVNKEYRQKNEGAFARYIFDETNLKWNVIDKNGIKYAYGSSVNSRISNGDKIFAWFLDRVEDVYGNYITYIYERDVNAQTYLKEIHYTGSVGLESDKSILFGYDETRTDKLYNYRTGWKIQTVRRLKEIQIKVDEQLEWKLKWKYVLSYEQSLDTGRSLLAQITLFDAEGNSLPPKKFKYQTIK